MARLSLLLGQAAAWLVLAAIGVTLWEVVLRYVFNAPTSWAHALATVLCGVAFAFGGAYALAQDEHIRIGAVYERLTARRRAAVDGLGMVLGVFYLGGLGLGLWGQASEAVFRFDWQGRWAPELTPGPPNWPLPSVMRVALVVGTLLFLGLLVQRLAMLFRKPGA